MKRPTYTLTSLIKRVFRPGERSLPKSEINQRLKDCLGAYGNEMTSEEVLDQVLALEHSPIKYGHTDAIVEMTYQPHQLFDLAYRFLRDTHMPRTVEQIVPELRRQTQFSWNQVKRMLVLERDPRFVQYQGDKRWYLADWKVANDRVYQFALENGIKQIALRSLSYFLEHEVRLSPKEDIFLLEADDRFQLHGETITICEPATNTSDTSVMDDAPSKTEEKSPENGQTAQAEQMTLDEQIVHDEQTAAHLLPSEESLAVEQVAATLPPPASTVQLSFEEESFMNTVENTVENRSVTGEVSQLLKQALGHLEQRNQQMAAEVVSYFQQSNMQAIEVLMKEKHKNEQIAIGLQQLLALTEEQ